VETPPEKVPGPGGDRHRQQDHRQVIRLGEQVPQARHRVSRMRLRRAGGKKKNY
jgi:hypothetical protein